MTEAFDLVDEEHMSVKERKLLKWLRQSYTEETLQNILLPIVTQTSPISLRALDWSCVNWAKKNTVICASQTPGELTNMYSAYRTTLQFWKRRLFDPFRRRGRIPVVIAGETYETTLGQANFALFAYRTGILAYVLTHIDRIEQDMNAVVQAQKKIVAAAKRSGVARKRKELTSGESGVCVAYTAPRRVHVR